MNRLTEAGIPLNAEWLETDGLGGFASGTVGGIRSRRYHGWLVCATTPPTGRVVLVNGVEAWLETPRGRFALSAHRYWPDVVYPDGQQRLISFNAEPWPVWTFRTEEGLTVEQALISMPDAPGTVIRWRLHPPWDKSPVRLIVRPLLSGRDYHALHHRNDAFRFQAQLSPHRVVWSPYPGLPAIVACTNGLYRHEPLWYDRFLYVEEQRRGLDCLEDLAAPGVFTWLISGQEAVLVLRADLPSTPAMPDEADVAGYASARFAHEAERRGNDAQPSARAGQFIVRRDTGHTLIAGYPWFTDWGRDTFIALRGLCLAVPHLDVAREILLTWSTAVSEGMLPNRFPDRGQIPEYNAVDASLWYIIAVHAYLRASRSANPRLGTGVPHPLLEAVKAILAAYATGTRYGIHMDADGLLAAGTPGVQLTWMDAKVGDRVVTPRIGKPVEVQALWLNALRIGMDFAPHWQAILERGLASFQERFWCEEAGGLYDVVDVDHEPGRVDAAFRPNQIFAVGGLPFSLLSGDKARRLVAGVEARLLTPLGLRTLDPGNPAYRGRYEGGVRERDEAYHQGTVWPWLMGPFVEAWLSVHGSTPEMRAEGRRRFLAPLRAHLRSAGLGHVSEIADGDPPHTPRGCPFQAWSLGELLRLERLLET